MRNFVISPAGAYRKGAWRWLAVPLFVLAPSLVAAQTLGDVERRIDSLERSTERHERKLRHLPDPNDREEPKTNPNAAALVELNDRMSRLERQLASLLASQEQDRQALFEGLNQLRRLKGDVDDRLSALESAPVPSPTQPAPAMSAPVLEAGPLTPDQRFAEAQGYATRGEWARAEEAFDIFLANNPLHPLAADARYWLGRAFFAQNKVAQAAQAFLEVYQTYPNAAISTENLLALASALGQLGPDSAAQACALYEEALGEKRKGVTPEQRNRVLDARLSLACSN